MQAPHDATLFLAHFAGVHTCWCAHFAVLDSFTTYLPVPVAKVQDAFIVCFGID